MTDEFARRKRLRRLDHCLDRLEAAHLENQLTVSPQLARELQEVVPSIGAGMDVAEAIEQVLAAQGPDMLDSTSGTRVPRRIPAIDDVLTRSWYGVNLSGVPQRRGRDQSEAASLPAQNHTPEAPKPRSLRESRRRHLRDGGGPPPG